MSKQFRSKQFRFRRLIACLLLLASSALLAAPPALAQPGDGGKVYLPLMTKASAGGQSSIQLIEQARENGAISDEQALIYKVQAVVGDPALPPRYRGDDLGQGELGQGELGQDGTSVMNEALEGLATVSESTRAILEPYLRAPSQPDSWIALNEPEPTGPITDTATVANATALTWETLDVLGGTVKIWYHPEYAADAARAQKIAAELQRHIWPKLTGMFRAPLADCGAACVEGGGDEGIDIYIAHITRSFVRRFELDSDGTPTFMVLEPDASFAVVAHELMHMIQFAYPLVSFAEYDWVFESTAQFAMDFVYPADNNDPDFPHRHEEQRVTPYFLDDTNLSLEYTNDKHEYGSYLYWFYLRSPEIIISVLQNMSQPNSLQTVNTAVAGGFQNAWPSFALYNWNQTPIEYYQQWDELKDSPEYTSNTFAGVGQDTFGIEVNHLGARYYNFDFIGESIRRVQVELPLALQGVETAHVWAMLKIDGQWSAPEDWTTVREKVFCRDNPGENIEQLVLIISNSNWQDRSNVLTPGDGTISTFASCGCQEANLFQEWTGTASISYAKTASDPDTYAASNRQAQLSFQLTREADTAFGNYRWQGDPTANSTASVNDQVSASGGSTFTWIGNEILPNTNRIRLEINPSTCAYEIWAGVFVDAIYNYGTGERQEIQHFEYRIYEIPIPVEATDWALAGSRTLPVQIGGGNEGVDRLFTGSGAMGQLDLLLDGELGTAPVTWSFMPVEPPEE